MTPIPDSLTPDDVADWLRRMDGRIEDIFGLWVQGKRDERWVGERLIEEGHLAVLTPPATGAASDPLGGLPEELHSMVGHEYCKDDCEVRTAGEAIDETLGRPDLREYARHKPGCASYMPSDASCSCGLAAALASQQTEVPS